MRSHSWFSLAGRIVLLSFSIQLRLNYILFIMPFIGVNFNNIQNQNDFIITFFSNCCPTRYPKKSVKLTGCPLTDLAIIFFKYLEDHGGDKCTCQYFSTAALSSGIIFWAICLSCGKSGWLYNVDKYLKVYFICLVSTIDGNKDRYYFQR